MRRALLLLVLCLGSRPLLAQDIGTGSCATGVKTLVDLEAPETAVVLGDTAIRYNPLLGRRYSPAVKRWMYYHACAHIIFFPRRSRPLEENEEGIADRYALTRLSAEFRGPAVQEAVRALVDLKSDPYTRGGFSHYPNNARLEGMERWADLQVTTPALPR
jgi:hypothetical protein